MEEYVISQNVNTVNVRLLNVNRARFWMFVCHSHSTIIFLQYYWKV